MPRYQLVRVGGPVGSGITQPHTATVQAVVKRNTSDDPYCVANELICGHLGQFIGLPIPPCGLFVEPRSPTLPPFFGSLSFNVTGDDLPPADPGGCVAAYSDPAHPRPDVVVGTLLFDVWVGNGDRHVRNLALDTAVSPPQLHVFDHSWALFGRERGKGAARLHRLRDELGVSESSSASGNRHCLLDTVRTNARFPFWLDRIRQVPDFVVTDVIDAVFRAGLIDGAEVTAARGFLQFRRAKLSAIINNSRAEFTRIPDADWSQL
jgi:hypothetical protein